MCGDWKHLPPSVVTKDVLMRFPALLNATRACFAISIGSLDSPEPLLIGRGYRIDCGSVKKIINKSLLFRSHVLRDRFCDHSFSVFFFYLGVKLQHSAVAGSQLLLTLPSLAANNSSLCRRWQATLFFTL